MTVNKATVTDGRASGPYDQERAEKAVRELLLALGEDPDREGLKETPARCLLYTSPSPRDGLLSRMPSSA